MNLLQKIRFARDRSVTVSNLVDELLRRKGNCEIGEEETRKWMLGDLHDEVCKIDSFLRHTIQLQPGQPVAIYRSNDARCFHWFLAVIRAGGIAVPLNPMLKLTEVRRILADSGTEIVVTDRASFERTILDQSALEVRTWIQAEWDADNAAAMDGFLRVSDSGDKTVFPPTVIDPKATIAVFHTSGTSGYPKGAALSSNALLGGRRTTVYFGLVLGPKDLALVALPWSHIMGVSIALNGMMAGVRGCILNHFEVERALELIERLGVTAVVGVPTMFAKLVNSNPDPRRLAKVRMWLSASDYLPTEVREQLRQLGALMRLPFGKRLPPLLLNGYGMVELGGLAMLGIEFSFLRGSSELCFPVPPYRIRVADENGKTVPAGEEGECQIWRKGIRPHYWKDNGDGELLTNDGWLHTGDLARKNRLGMIRLVGRTKDVFKSGGYSIYVRELEETILKHPAVARAAAFGLAHAEKGEIPAAAVELHPGAQASEAELLEWCRTHLAAYKAPRRIWIVESGSLPQNHNGKVLRRVLQERFAAQMI
jgi:acyl-CoA synthetase (AMP-forming)/AMP-acid ligase II